MTPRTRLALLIGIIALWGCAGKTAKVDLEALGILQNPPRSGEQGYRAKGAVGFRVAGEELFKGVNKEHEAFSLITNSASVDLKSLQEKLGSMVLQSVYDKVDPSLDAPAIQSRITDFGFRLYKNKRKVYQAPAVSFRLHLQAVRGGKVALERVVEVKDYEGKKSYVEWGVPVDPTGISYIFSQRDANHLSKVVTAAAAQAAYEAYLKELPGLAKALAE